MKSFNFFNNQLKNKQALTFGTFDLFHIGHKRLIKRIKRKTGKKVIVGVSSDSWNKIKGKKAIESEETRKTNVINYKHTKKVFFEDHSFDAELWDNWAEEKNIDVIILGADVKDRIPLNKITTPVYFISRTPFISSTLLRKWKQK